MPEHVIAPKSLDGPRRLRPEEEEMRAAHQLAETCFPGTVGPFDEQWIASHSPREQGSTYAICHQGKPVTQITITHSQVDVCSSPLRIGSIGDVCTHPDYRGYGLATKLLTHCTRQLTQEGARLMLISGTRELYRRARCVEAQCFAHFALEPGQLQLPMPSSAHKFTRWNRSTSYAT